MTAIVNETVAPELGALACNTEYRCVNTSLATAPSFTIAPIDGTDAVFQAAVVYAAPDGVKPVIVNNSGYALKYMGTHVKAGVWTPVAGTVYRLSLVFDGLNLNAYISGV